MVIKEAELLKMLVADLPADEYDFRLDVASPGFMLAWAQALERPVPSLVNMPSHPYPRRLAPPDACSADHPHLQVKHMIQTTDFFLECPKLVLEVLYTKGDGGYGADGRFQLCIAGARAGAPRGQARGGADGGH